MTDTSPSIWAMACWSTSATPWPTRMMPPRAVRAGLGMVEALGELNAHLARERGIRLVIRVGIHTGLVVVGEMGDGGGREQLALRDSPNVAARLLGLAAPD